MSSNTVDFPLWKTRWQAQKSYLGSLKSSVGTSTISRRTTILSLIEQLEIFGQSQMDFFEEAFVQGFIGGAKCKASDKNEYPPDFALSVTIQQIGFDIDVIEKCTGQRSLGQPAIQQKLQLADKLAYEALKPAIDHTIIDDKTTIITYFQKSPDIRVIPYAPVLLVGIPFSCLNQPRDFLAIPHEVGHYVFWHGNFEKKKSFTKTWDKNWYEEIFADIYGALIAGPVIGLDFQELQAARKTEDFFDDDGDHPAPVLRPFIHTNFFATDGTYKNWGAKLQTEWDKILKVKYSIADKALQIPSKDPTQPVDKRRFKKGDGHLEDIEEAITPAANSNKPLDKIIDHVTTVLDKIPASAWPNELQDTQTGSSVDIKTLYAQFEGYLNSVEASLLSSNPPIKVPDFDISAHREYVPTLFQKIIDLRNNIRNGDEDTCWLRVLYAEGWATKGPKCEGSSGVC